MSNTDGPAALRQLAGSRIGYDMCLSLAAAWEAERAQAAADRAEIANCLENIRELTAQRRTREAVIADVRSLASQIVYYFSDPNGNIVSESSSLANIVAGFRAWLEHNA